MGKIGGDDGGYAFDVGDFRCFDPADALPANDLVQFPFPFMDVFADFTAVFYPHQVAAEFPVGLLSGDQVTERDSRKRRMVVPGQVLNGFGLPICEDLALLNGCRMLRSMFLNSFPISGELI